jgi:hypothetical protein
MKKADKSAGTNRNFDAFISKLSEDEILDPTAMMWVRGGEGDGTTTIILPPPPPPHPL